MPPLKLRHSVRAIILDEKDRVLLCRCVLPGEVVWVTPGGGVEEGGSMHAALKRELHEEVGLVFDAPLPHVWQQRLIGSAYARGHDGVRNDYFLVRTSAFEPVGALSEDELVAESITAIRWWDLKEIAEYRGPELFGPHNLAAALRALLVEGVPVHPLPLGP
ncbi:NUDIX domain-containing protein [Streptomyces sp. NPDC048405]|uniref:NUDIX domain-containing protein n=1 Tax=Streptomyces TaxID=1883 RepID=UPI002852A539|nr:NUDIX domain-containing protein [Streptomyces salinarius]